MTHMPDDPDPELAAKLDDVIERAIAQQRIVGCVVLAAERGRLVYRRAAGFADRELGRPMQPDTIFRYASLTKPIVTIAAMRLVEAGRLSLDEPLTTWLPNFRPKLDDGREPVILLRHLLTHMAGLSYAFADADDDPYNRAGVSDGMDQPGLSLQDNLDRIAAHPLLYPPGQGWRYSVAMDVMGGVIEAEMGMRLGEAVAELVMKPLGLTDTGFTVANKERLAVPYVTTPAAPRRMEAEDRILALTGFIRFSPDRIFNPASFHSGGAGMAGTAQDMMAILETIRAGGAPLLSSHSASMMMQDQTAGYRHTVDPGCGFGFGWGLAMDPRLSLTPWPPGTIHWGGVYGHSWFIDRERDLTIVALTNTSLEGMWGQFAMEIRDAPYQAP